MLLPRTLTEQQLRSLPLRLGQDGCSVSELARGYGVSRKTIYAGLERLRKAHAKVSVLRQVGRPLGLSLKRQVWLQRLFHAHARKRSWGACKLRLWLATKYGQRDLPPERTLHRWLKQAGKVKVRRVRRKAGKGMLCSTKADQPNAIWTVDFKGDWWTADGRRVLVLTVRDLCSRFVLCVQALEATSEELVHRVFVRLFSRHGQPMAIRSDQGAPFCGVGPYGLTKLSVWWMRLGIEVQFVRRASGIDNNAHEEMHRRLKREAATPPSLTYKAQLRRLYRWRIEYNQTSQYCLGKNSPQQLYAKYTKSRNGLSVPTYPSQWMTRKVRTNGSVKLHGSLRHVGRAFTGLCVAFEPVYCGYRVHFMHLQLGWIDPKTPSSGLRTFGGKRFAGGGYSPPSKPSQIL